MWSIWVFLSLAVALPVAAFLVLIGFNIWGKRSSEGAPALKGYRVLILAAGVVGGLFFLNYAAGYFALKNAAEGVVHLSLWETVGSSLLKTAKAVGVDENVDQFILELKKMLQTMQGKVHWLQEGFGVYTGFLYILGPVLGGVGLLEVLAGVFPQVRLFFTRFAWWKDKYYFSQLNDGSLELARGLCRVDMKGLLRGIKRPTLIFTGVDADKKDQDFSQRLDEAKTLGAICLNSDLKSTGKWGFGNRKYFLVEEDEMQVLQQLVGLATEENQRYMDKAEIFFFVNSDAYEPVEKNVRQTLKEKGIQPSVIKPIRTNFNLIKDLLTDIPLFEPLIGKEKKPDGTRDLVVAILGAGGLGMEMLLNTYWIGQMLDCNLIINVYSKEEEKDFWSKLDYVNPEIRRTTDTKEEDLLQIYSTAEPRAKTYCTISYQKCNLDAGSLGEEEKAVQDADYCFVALGSDKDNIAVANAVRRQVGVQHIEKNSHHRTVIAYVVYDPLLTEVLNKERRLTHFGEEADVYMQAVGSLQDVYSIRNVFAADHAPRVQATYDSYWMKQAPEKRKKAYEKRIKDTKTEYDYWASLARILHEPYKLYSVGVVKTSIFEALSKEEFLKKRREEYGRGIKLLHGCPEEGNIQGESYVQLLHRMAWLEHRRWNAFTRTMGFRKTKAQASYREKTKSHKHMALRLHPCLVECDEKGIRTGLTEAYTVDMAKEFQCTDTASFDLLDILSYELHEKYGHDYDFKRYDYPSEDFKSGVWI